METQTQIITSEIISNARNYADYRAFIAERLTVNQSTGTNHSESIVGYTTLNDRRMKRLDKTTKLAPETLETLQLIERPQVWVVLTEGWCGDAAQSVPVMAKMADATPNVEFKLILRDENLEIMDAFLTNGGRSIPKLILLDKETLDVLGTWGPRPAPAQNLLMTAKKSPDFDYPKVQKELQLWYAKDKTLTTQGELVAVIKNSI